MKFSGEQAHQIATGAKTELRKPWASLSPYRTLEHAVQVERPRTYADAPAKHADDTTVIETVCSLTIVGQRVATLSDMTELDARAEGFRASGKLTALAQFREWWAGRYGNELERVWVVRFEVERDEKPIYIARGGGYTHTKDRAVDELPAVPPKQVDKINARRARGMSWDQRVEAKKRDARARAAKLRDAERTAIGKGVDISAEVAAIDHYLETIRGKIDSGDAEAA